MLKKKNRYPRTLSSAGTKSVYRSSNDNRSAAPVNESDLSLFLLRSVGGEISKLRKARRMTQTKLARAANILRPNLARIEAGKHRPTLETLEKLAGALKVPVVDLIASR